MTMMTKLLKVSWEVLAHLKNLLVVMLGSTNFSSWNLHKQNIKVLIINENKRCEIVRASQTDHDHEKHMSK
jgi:hypothetical protein